MLRISKIILIALVGLWGLVGGVQNFTQIDIGFQSVAAVLNPQDVSGLADWQGIDNPLMAVSQRSLNARVSAFVEHSALPILMKHRPSAVEMTMEKTDRMKEQ